MREHYILDFQSKDKPPIGDMGSWLRFYKLNPDAEEAYIPAPPEFASMVTGDILWISLDHVVLAGVPITRWQTDEFNKRLEIWYDARLLRFYPSDLPSMSVGIKLPHSVGESWWNSSLEKRPDARAQEAPGS